MNNDKPMYGIWIANQGWLKGNGDIISFDDFSFANEVAGIMEAKVRRIDNSWKDLEAFYLEQENKRKSLWHIFKNYFKFNKNKSISNSKTT